MTTSVHTLPISLEQHLQPADLAAALRHDVAVGLAATPKRLPPKWFYDERGSRLFDQITRLPEYYPTRAERALLERIAPEVAAVTGADTLVELGCGTSDKTRLLLAALREAGVLRRFVPFDVDAATLTAAGVGIAAEFPGVEVHAVVGDFERHVPRLPRSGRRLVAFLGSTIGNLEPPARAAFFADIAANLRPGDAFLLGADLVKEPGRLVAAYDDADGVTAEFNRNVLLVINRELQADFDPAAFDHVALWDAGREWMEMRLRSRHHQVVRIPALNLAVPFATGEELHTEISAKFRQNGVGVELAAAGLRMIRWWTDSSGDVALSLAVPGSPSNHLPAAAA